jgi:hypothetical protein
VDEDNKEVEEEKPGNYHEHEDVEAGVGLRLGDKASPSVAPKAANK